MAKRCVRSDAELIEDWEAYFHKTVEIQKDIRIDVSIDNDAFFDNRKKRISYQS